MYMHIHSCLSFKNEKFEVYQRLVQDQTYVKFLQSLSFVDCVLCQGTHVSSLVHSLLVSFHGVKWTFTHSGHVHFPQQPLSLVW